MQYVSLFLPTPSLSLFLPLPPISLSLSLFLSLFFPLSNYIYFIESMDVAKDMQNNG